MEMTTSYRYEGNVPRAAALRQALARQQARIKETELLASIKSEINEEFNKFQIAKWNEASESVAETKRVKRYNETLVEEVKTASTQLLALRRENLKHLLETEKQQHALELEALGLTYFTCRL